MTQVRRSVGKYTLTLHMLRIKRPCFMSNFSFKGMLYAGVFHHLIIPPDSFRGDSISPDTGIFKPSVSLPYATNHKTYRVSLKHVPVTLQQNFTVGSNYRIPCILRHLILNSTIMYTHR